jgi:hypothetical protein
MNKFVIVNELCKFVLKVFASLTFLLKIINGKQKEKSRKNGIFSCAEGISKGFFPLRGCLTKEPVYGTIIGY